MNLTCPECKNQIDLSRYADLQVESVVECDICGITLQITSLNNDKAEAEVIDEGK
ncbi:MAG: hypothetical protein ABH832_01525 [bacterium]